jgi:tetratricopeptide (TPR) repeat protein
MDRRGKVSPGLAALTACLILIVAGASAQTKLPGGVTSRVKKINDYLATVETRLKTGYADRNNLEKAVDTLEEIKKGYPANVSSPEVAAVEKRIADLTRMIKELEAGKQKAQAGAPDPAAAEKMLVDWAERLSAYKADERPGSKGNFGVPTEDIDTLLACKPSYEEAIGLYSEFLKSGLDKDSHYRLREAEYDIRIAMQNYESSRNRIPDMAAEKLDATLQWMQEKRASGASASLPAEERRILALLVENATRLLPDSDRVRALNQKKAELDRLMEDTDATILENRSMLADQYKGQDSSALKKLAQSLVLKNEKGATVLKVVIASPAWERESVEEWTDTTRTALRRRITDSVNAQVAVRLGKESYLYMVFLNKDTIDGKESALTGHVMFRDRILEKNIR